MRTAKRLLFVLLAVAAMLVTSVAQSELPVIESFPRNGPPGQGQEFLIKPVEADPALGRVEPLLIYGEESPDGTADTLVMMWGPPSPSPADFQGEAGWELIFGEDPDLQNVQMSLSINPPGGIDPNGNFNGISSVSVVAIAVGNIVAGGWGFNTDKLNPGTPPVNDPTAAGLVSLQNNAMHTVTINVGTGPVAGSATIVGPAGSFVGPNFLIPGNNDFANIISLQFFENGILMANVDLTAVIPGQTFQRIVNYWDHLTFTPPVVVDIDIKPGSDPNSVNLKSKGVLPVAILTTAAFDAQDVDPGTVQLAGVAPLRWAVGDVNGDGIADMLFHFSVPALVAAGVLDANTTSLTLTGKKTDGVAFSGTDSVRIPPGASKPKK